jgi:hypothetical protein
MVQSPSWAEGEGEGKISNVQDLIDHNLMSDWEEEL